LILVFALLVGAGNLAFPIRCKEQDLRRDSGQPHLIDILQAEVHTHIFPQKKDVA